VQCHQVLVAVAAPSTYVLGYARRALSEALMKRSVTDKALETGSAMAHDPMGVRDPRCDYMLTGESPNDTAEHKRALDSAAKGG
jgi:hypothetical protein